MAQTPREQYQSERDKLEAAAERGDVSAAERDTIKEFLDARDSRAVSVPSGDMKTTDSGHSLRSYCNTLRKTAERSRFDLTDATAEGVNRHMHALVSGEHPDADDGLSPRTVNSYQGVLRKFYEYHARFGVDPSTIEIMSVDRTPVDERDMFSGDEIEAMRGAIDNNRDRALSNCF